MIGFTRTIKCAAAAFVAAAMLIVATLPSQADTGTVRFRVGSAGFIVGVPTPVAGTSYALVVLGLAGIREAMDVIRGMQSSPAAPHRQPPPR